MAMTNKQSGTAALILCAAGIAFSALLNKLAMSAGMHPAWINVLRLGIALLGTLVFLLRKPATWQTLSKASPRDKALTVLAGVMLGIHFTTWTMSLRYADSVVAVSIWSTFSLMTVVGSSWLLHEKTPRAALLGILIATVGVGVCTIGTSGSQALGIVMALIAAVTQAAYTLCGRAARKHVDTLPYTLTAYTVAFAGLVLYALIGRVPADGMNAQGIGASVALAVVCTLGGHSMQNHALRYYKAPTVSALMLTEVFTGPLLVYVFLGEAPSLISVLGGAIIIAGVAWYMVYERRESSGAIRSDRTAA